VLIRIDTSNARPLYEQIAAQVRDAIIGGEVAGGDRLPAAKELAEAIGVNLHTVLRAYAALRDEGLIELRPRRGAVVTTRAPHERLTDQARSLVRQAQSLGLSTAEILDLVADQI
jgi:GntR family transcriptional regulator